jgi:hypothetical protein
MASTGHINATLFKLYNGANTIGYAEDVQFEFSAETIEVTTKDSGGYAEYIHGKKSFSGTVGLKFREDATYGYNDLMTLANAGTSFTAKWSTGVTGDKYEQGTVFITSISRGGGAESSFDAQVSLQGSSTLTIGTES